MAMLASDLAVSIADGMKADGLFNVPTSEGMSFSQDAYDSTLSNLTRDWGTIIDYLKSNMDVVQVATEVETTVSTTGSAAAQTGTGTGTGTQTGTGKVL